MSDDRAKTARSVLISDHLWETLGAMAAEMGSDRDALVNQALYTFARLNGFLLPSDLARLLAQPGGAAASVPVPPPAAASADARGRVAELAQELAASGMPRSRTVPPPVEISGASGMPAPPVDAAEAAAPGVAAPASRTLVLLADGRELGKVLKDRFIIGRGKHCDLVIHSGKVSREHAAITRQGSDYFIEDLGSSNGTWFEKRRITRRQIEEGDEYYISGE